jgi:uncharacterized protein (TIGR03067 family)
MTHRQRTDRLGVGLCALVLAAVPGPLLAQDKKAVADLEKFQGKWEILTTERGGESQTEMGPEAFRIFAEFKDDKFTLSLGKKVSAKGTVKLDPATSPKTIDLVYEGNTDPTLRGEVRLGIYEIDGDTLRMCCTDLYSKGPRPKEFKTAKGDKFSVQTFKRVK